MIPHHPHVQAAEREDAALVLPAHHLCFPSVAVQAEMPHHTVRGCASGLALAVAALALAALILLFNSGFGERLSRLLFFSYPTGQACADFNIATNPLSLSTPGGRIY